MPICVYCLNEKDEITDDHVIARSWYPGTTPDNLEKWQVPSCQKCNNRFSRLEEEMLLHLAMCLDPNGQHSSKIVKWAFRSIDPSLGKTEKEKRIRGKKREKIAGKFTELEQLPEKGVLPTFKSNWDRGSRIAFQIPASDLNNLVRKWFRGIHYKTTKRLIPHFIHINVFHITDDAAKEALKKVTKPTAIFKFGPGLTIFQILSHEKNHRGIIYGVNIWDQFKVYGSFEEQLTNSS